MTATVLDLRPSEVGRRLVARAAQCPVWVPVYGLPGLVAFVVVAAWFRPGMFVAVGDISPFVRDNLRSELWSSWNHQLSGGGSASYDVARVADVVLLRFSEAVGAPATAAQRLLYAGSAAFAAAAGAFWVRALGVGPIAAVLGGLIAVFNPYVMVNLPNLLPLLSIGVAGALGGLVLRTAAGRRVGVVPVVVATLPVSYVSLNPPLVAMLLAWVGLCLAVVAVTWRWDGLRRALRLLGLAAPVVVLLHLWWIVPALQTLRSGGAGVVLAAETDLDAWAWTQAENSVANVVTLRAAWGWPFREYIPYAGSLDAWPWWPLAWLLPVGALAGVVLSRGSVQRRACWLLAATGMVLLFVGKGIHPPWSDVNQSLYDSFPGFWLLREPMSKVGVLLVPIYALLVAVAADRSLGAIRASHSRVLRVGAVALAGVCALALIYPRPLWTGAVVPDQRGLFPGAHVPPPVGWEAPAALVNSSDSRGKALVLPLDPQYQVLTTWGYQGVDTVPQQLLTRPVIQPLPDIYFRPPQGFLDRVAAIEQALVIGNVAEVPRLLDELGVSHLLVRHDLAPSPLLPSSAPASPLVRSARYLPGWRHAGAFPVTDVFERTSSAPMVGVDPAAGPPVRVPDPATGSLVVDQPGPHELRVEPRGLLLHHVTSDGRQVRARTALAAALDGRPLFGPTDIVVPTGTPAEAIELGTTVLGLGPGDTPVLAPAGGSATLWGADAPVAATPLAPAPRCAKAHSADPPVRPTAEGGMRLTPPRDAKTCVSAQVLEAPQADHVYRIRFAHRAVSGLGGELCVRLTDEGACSELPALLSDESWRQYVGFVRVDPGATQLRVELSAASAKERRARPSVVEYAHLQVERMARVGTLPLASLPPTTAIDLAAGPHTVAMTPAAAPAPAPLQFSPLEDCYPADGRGAPLTGLSASVDQGVVRLAARRHIACVWADVDTRLAFGRYRVRFDHRTISGKQARVCLWQEGVGRCARMAQPRRSGSWASYSADVQVEPGTTALRLYLYADGGDERRTVTEYRGLTGQALAPVEVQAVPVAAPPPEPAVTWEAVGPSAYEVSLDGVPGEAALSLAETYAPGWRLEGLPAGWKARHQRTDGYANGWRLSGTGRADVRLVYAPATIARRAAQLSALTAVVLIAAVAVVGIRARRRRAPQNG